MRFTCYLLLLPLAAFAAVDTWQPFAIDRQLTVQLPAKATELNMAKLLPAGQAPARTRTWVAQASEGLCVVMRVPNINSQRIKQGDAAHRQVFYEDAVRGALAAENHAYLLKRTRFQTAGGNGIEIKYTALDARTGRHRVRYMRTLVVDSIGYNLIFRPANLSDSLGLVDYTQRRRFFDSITVNP
jgi:hypothetical protein